MRLLAKPLLWLLTSAIPVFIAACYGAPVCAPAGGDDDDSDDDGDDFDTEIADKRSFRGTVRSASDGVPIPYIRVECGILGMDGAEIYDATYSTVAGAFELWYSQAVPCDFLRFEDVDGSFNGAFASKEVSFDGAVQDDVYELEAQD